MIKHGLENINIENPIKDKLPMLIEYFVKFYGEKYREKITNRLYNTTFILAEPIDGSLSLSSLISHFEKKKDEVYNNFAREAKDKYSVNANIIEYIKNNKPDKYISSTDIEKCIKLFNKKYKPSIDYLNSEYKRISAPLREFIKKSSKIHQKYANLRNILLKNTSSQYLNDNIKKLEQERNRELLTINPGLQRLKKEIMNKNIHPNNIINNLEDYILNNDNIVAYIEHTYKETSPNQHYSICVLPSYFLLENQTLIHELNHIIESDIIYNNENEMAIKCGFGYCVYDKNINIYYGNCEKHFLNEVVNDYIASKINSNMEKDGSEIGFIKSTPKVYSMAFPYIREYIEDNFEKIISCRLSDDTNCFSNFYDKELEKIANETYLILSGTNKEKSENSTEQTIQDSNSNSKNKVFPSTRTETKKTKRTNIDKKQTNTERENYELE